MQGKEAIFFFPELLAYLGLSVYVITLSQTNKLYVLCSVKEVLI
jgi:hypothetical protein